VEYAPRVATHLLVGNPTAQSGRNARSFPRTSALASKWRPEPCGRSCR